MIARGEFDVGAVWCGFSDKREGGSFTPFEYALRIWYRTFGPQHNHRFNNGHRPDLTLLLKLLYHGGIPDEVSEAVRRVVSYMFYLGFGYAAGPPEWYTRGKQILAGDLPHSAWDPETLVDQDAPRIDRLTAFHLLLQKHFMPVEVDAPSPTTLPPFGASDEKEDGIPSGIHVEHHCRLLVGSCHDNSCKVMGRDSSNMAMTT